jgi:Tol biopolymer transport system component
MRSSLEIFDLETETTAVVHRTDRLIEAPNWSPDGSELVFNGDGRLFRLTLGGVGEPQEIDTGFASELNNDHGISGDGTLIVISDQTEAGESCIYTLPYGGGAPRRVTDRTPSYWHGWSPDGSTLAYCAKRDGVFDIYSIAVEGGPERRLTDGAGHSDGPDYTPDGEWIWFNSSRAGAMSLWRMHPDGGGLERMTEGGRADWFPHPSPDGRHVAFLAYAPGTAGHPRDRDVELKLMPAAGGDPRTLLQLFGGQGTINVPSWSPDGKKFAFVRYQRPQQA